MKPHLKQLLQYLADNDYEAEDVITIIEGLKPYKQARYDFNRSDTPETTALARWGLHEARRVWLETGRTYRLQLSDPELYY